VAETRHTFARFRGFCMTPGATILYKCLFCDFASTKRAALAGHMQRHKGKTAVLAVRIDRELRDKFTDLCHRHNTTTCQLLTGLIKATLKGEEVGTVDLRSINPMIINVNEYFLGKPRSGYKALISSRLGLPKEIPRCWRIGLIDLDKHEIYCLRGGLFVAIEGCMRCNLREGSVGLRG